MKRSNSENKKYKMFLAIIFMLCIGLSACNHSVEPITMDERAIKNYGLSEYVKTPGVHSGIVNDIDGTPALLYILDTIEKKDEGFISKVLLYDVSETITSHRGEYEVSFDIIKSSEGLVRSKPDGTIQIEDDKKNRYMIMESITLQIQMVEENGTEVIPEISKTEVHGENNYLFEWFSDLDNSKQYNVTFVCLASLKNVKSVETGKKETRIKFQRQIQ